MSNKNLKGVVKRGQVGDAITWMVATLVIIGILIVTFIISGVGDLKNIDVDSKSVKNHLAKKSLSSYVFTIGKEELASKKIEEADENKLAVRLFKEMHDVGWVGIAAFDGFFFKPISNDFFGSGIGGVGGGGPSISQSDFFSLPYNLRLGDEKEVRLYFDVRK